MNRVYFDVLYSQIEKNLKVKEVLNDYFEIETKEVKNEKGNIIALQLFLKVLQYKKIELTDICSKLNLSPIELLNKILTRKKLYVNEVITMVNLLKLDKTLIGLMFFE